VITSITGIMILIVLLLILDVMQREELKQVAAKPTGPTREQVEGQIARARERIRELRKKLTEEGQVTQLVNELDEVKVREQLSRARAEMRELEAAIRAVTEEIERKKAVTAEAERKADERRAQLRRLKAELDSVKASIEKKDMKPRVEFVFGEVTEKVPILVECSGTSLRAKVLGPTPEVKDFTAGGDYRASILAFQRWADNQDKQKSAFVLLVKPSSAEYVMGLAESLRKMGVDVGYEPLEEEKGIVF
jgi:hypothetical protein